VTWNVLALAGALAGAGAVSGFLAGLFGVGGGSIVVAALYQAFTYAGIPDDLCMRMSLGTAFAIMVPTSPDNARGRPKARNSAPLAFVAMPERSSVTKGRFPWLGLQLRGRQASPVHYSG
jgi:uncharacterized membrane protein YfcA